MTDKILISGYSGFVGQNLARHLAPRYNLAGISHKNRSTSVLQHVYSWDSLSISDLSGTNCILHLAGKAHDTKNVSAKEEYFKINTELTKTLFDLFLKSDATTFIYFSSVKAVADSVDGILNESCAPNPKTPYGQSKLKAEEYLLAQRLPSGKRLFIIRPCMIHGPLNKGNLNLLYKVVKKGIPYPLGAFENKRSLLSISNLNFIIEKLVGDAMIPGGIYNVADDRPLSTNEIIDVIAKTSGLKTRIWNLNKKVIEFAASAGDKLHLPLNSERLKKLTESYVVSNDKVKKALRINDLPVPSAEGLEITIKSFLTQ